MFLKQSVFIPRTAMEASAEMLIQTEATYPHGCYLRGVNNFLECNLGSTGELLRFMT